MNGSGNGEGKTVLVAEHLAIVGMWLEDVLTEAGLAVDGPYPTCEGALAAFQQNRPDYAIVSVDLRQGSCFALACALRQADVPFVLVSGSVPVPPAFRDVPLVERPCLEAEVVASLPRALSVARRHRTDVAACPRAMRRDLSPTLPLDQCPPACGA